MNDCDIWTERHPVCMAKSRQNPRRQMITQEIKGNKGFFAPALISQFPLAPGLPAAPNEWSDRDHSVWLLEAQLRLWQ